ncbi:hypothetical protein DESC_200010 [Desulfosarcina cetonica]|nr:hypothetical protein DESC_200010 [Desulfosarcina cetonica]
MGGPLDDSAAMQLGAGQDTEQAEVALGPGQHAHDRAVAAQVVEEQVQRIARPAGAEDPATDLFRIPAQLPVRDATVVDDRHGGKIIGVFPVDGGVAIVAEVLQILGWGGHAANDEDIPQQRRVGHHDPPHTMDQIIDKVVLHPDPPPVPTIPDAIQNPYLYTTWHATGNPSTHIRSGENRSVEAFGEDTNHRIGANHAAFGNFHGFKRTAGRTDGGWPGPTSLAPKNRQGSSR